MTPFFAYLIKSSISLAVLYSLFRFVMRNDKNHTLNRFLLLGILVVSAIIPFLNIQFFYEEVALKQVEVIREFVSAPVFSEVSPQEIIQPINEANSFSINPWLAFYILIIVALLSRIVFGVIKVTQIIKRAEKRRLQKIVLAVVKDLIQPFTFLNKVVISEKDFTENKDIIVAHEHAHIKHLHALDLMVCEVFTLVHFFNPFIWLLRRDLKLIHEYQADQAVLQKGIDAKKYQLLVLQKSVGERRFAMANHFTQKPILKRLKMMHKKKKNQWGTLKLVLFAPVLILLIQAFSRPELITEKVNEIVPNFIQQDSSELWLKNWTIENLSKINGGLITEEYEIAPPPPGSPKSGLPKYDKTRDGNPIPTANILTVLVNRKNQILASNTAVNMDELLNGIKNFLHGDPPFKGIKNGPEQVAKNLPFVGNVKVTKGVITMRYDVDTEKDFIDNLLLEIGKLHLETRENQASEKFNQNYFSLPADKKDVINQMVPIQVSIMEPKTVKPPPPPPPLKIELRKDGLIYLGPKMKKYTIDEFVKNLPEIDKEYKDFNEKHNVNYSIVTSLKVEEGVTESQITRIKEILRNSKILNINYSTKK